MKIFFRNIHLYLSLAAGLVIMICCFTGAVLVFEKELQQMLDPQRYFVELSDTEKQQAKRLPIDSLTKIVKATYPDAKIGSVRIYPDAERTIEIGVTLKKSKDAQNKGKAPAAAAPAGPGRPTHTVFINPYSGEITDLYNYRETFFYTMFALHRWLLGNDSSIGKTITGVSTLVFLFIIITGIILWWPKNMAILKQRLKIKTNANWKRVNHDLHIVLGFYSSIILFIFAFTALAWSFKWFNDGIYSVTGTTPKSPEAPKSEYVADTRKAGYDAAFASITAKVPEAQFYTLRAPNDSTGTYNISVLPIGAHESASDVYYANQYTGEIIGDLKFSEKNVGQRVRAAFKPIHVGSIFGLPSKIIAVIVCLLGVSFPITGVIMWINRLKK